MDLTNGISNTIIDDKFDLAKGEKSFEENGSKRKIGIAKFKTDGRATIVSLKGQICTNGICVNEFSNGKVYSLGFRFETDDELENFNKFNEKLVDFVDQDYSCLNIVKDEVLYLKLKLKNDKKGFLVESNKKLDPKKPSDFPQSGDEVVVKAEVSAFFNFEDKKCGVLLNLKSFDFI